MGGCSSKSLRDTPVVAYAQTHSRSQVHEVAVLPLTTANFPSSDCPAFQRLHQIYQTCPRVRQHFAHASDQVLERDEFYRQVVGDASQPTLPDGTPLPVAVATRWRGDEQWDMAGYIGCRGFDSKGRRTDVCQLQMFFKDGHKVPLTMPAIQLAARLFAEMHLLANEGSAAIPWPANVEWTMRRTNMEVRRVLEAVLVFWGLRPGRSGVPDHAAPPPPAPHPMPPGVVPTPYTAPAAFAANLTQPQPLTAAEYMAAVSMSVTKTSQAAAFAGLPSNAVGGNAQHQRHAVFRDATPFMPTFPLEQRSLSEEFVTLGSAQLEAIASCLGDLAGWSSSAVGRWATGAVPSHGLEALLPPNFQARGGKVLLTGLSMNFRGTQQKTPAERREVLGEAASAMLELVQPAPRDPNDPRTLQQEAAAASRQQRKQQQQQQQAQSQSSSATPGRSPIGLNGAPPGYHSATSAVMLPSQLMQQRFVPQQPQQQQQMVMQQQQPPFYGQQQQQQQPQQVSGVSSLMQSLPPAPAGFVYALIPLGNGTLQPALVPIQQQQQQQQQPQVSGMFAQQQMQPVQFATQPQQQQQQSTAAKQQPDWIANAGHSFAPSARTGPTQGFAAMADDERLRSMLQGLQLE